MQRAWAAQDNLLHGRFLAELTQEVLSDLEASKYQHAEYRISIYGRKRVEWDILAAWICQNQLYSDNVVWLIQARRHLTIPLGACLGEGNLATLFGCEQLFTFWQ